MPCGRCASTLTVDWRPEWESAHVAFDAAELKLPELGYMVENKVLQWGLWQALTAHEGVTLRVGGELEAMQRGEAETALRLRDGETIHARLVIGADGASSQVREMAGIGVHARQYQQSCMLISVQCADDPGDSTGSSLPQRTARFPAAVRQLGLAGVV